jgi:hypothetical protein
VQYHSAYKKTINQLAKKVKYRRVELEMSQQELAYQAQIDRTYVSQLERGLANPSLSVLIALAISLKIPLKSLIEKDR